LEALGARVEYNDPNIPVIRPSRDHSPLAGRTSKEISADYDLLLISTAHEAYKHTDLLKFNIPLVDTRNTVKTNSPLYFKA
jgi:UDP-N-acetyl-D-glucosamine dehydrogenase